MTIYTGKQSTDRVLEFESLEDGSVNCVPAGHTMKPAICASYVDVPQINIGCWGWSWEFGLAFPSDKSRRAFRQLFESLPQDVQHSLCSAPSNCQARLAFCFDKLPTIPDDVQRNEVEVVLRAAFARAAARQAATFWED